MNLEDIVDLGFLHAHHVLVELKRPSLMPTIVIVQPNNTVDIIGLSWANDKEKKQTCHTLKEKMKNDGSLAYCLIGEAWSATYSRQELREGVLPPSKSDRRIEVVVAVAAERSGVKMLKSQGIVRDSDGRVTGFEDSPEPVGVTDMGGLLD